MHQNALDQRGVAPTIRSGKFGSQERTYEIKFKLVLALPNLKLSRANLEAMLAVLQQQAFHVWALFSALRIVCALRVATVAPTLFFYLRLLKILPRVLESGDAFTFYDASNTLTRLPVVEFQHWEVFKARLDCKFRDTPGRSIVLEGRFTLTGSHVQGLVINTQD